MLLNLSRESSSAHRACSASLADFVTALGRDSDQRRILASIHSDSRVLGKSPDLVLRSYSSYPYLMAECAVCGAETTLYISEVPICLECSNELESTKKPLRPAKTADAEKRPA
jgi:hypothetical protein